MGAGVTSIVVNRIQTLRPLMRVSTISPLWTHGQQARWLLFPRATLKNAGTTVTQLGFAPSSYSLNYQCEINRNSRGCDAFGNVIAATTTQKVSFSVSVGQGAAQLIGSTSSVGVPFVGTGKASVGFSAQDYTLTWTVTVQATINSLLTKTTNVYLSDHPTTFLGFGSEDSATTSLVSVIASAQIKKAVGGALTAFSRSAKDSNVHAIFSEV